MSVVKNVDERAFEMQKEERAWTVTEEQQNLNTEMQIFQGIMHVTIV